MFIDTHTHFYSRKFSHDREAAVQRARQAGVGGFYLPNIDSASAEAMLAMEAAHPDRFFAMMGLHPCSVQAETLEEELGQVREWLDRRRFCAIGEIGIDLYWDTSTLDLQRAAFQQQIEWAKELDRPIVIHSRASIDLIIDMLAEAADDRLRGIFHCFTGDEAQGQAIVELGFLLGIGGVLTFKNGGLDKTLPALPLQAMVLETDSPYLAPTPHRGRRNESSYLPLIARRLAEVKGCSLEEIAEVTTHNALKVFGPDRQFLPPEAGITAPDEARNTGK